MRTAWIVAFGIFAALPPVAAQEMPARWQLAADGRAFAQYMRSGTIRGAQAFGSSNWFMLAVSRESEASRLALVGLGSFEPLTLGECGYPRLLTPPGFLCFDRALEDLQHTHPLIMSLAASYERSLGESSMARLYAGAIGEPAFGPAPFFHRASAQFDPIAPLSNDMLNPAHISYGLVTAGLATGPLLWEASVFNGRSPDRNPYDFDFAPMHSYAGRASAQLSETLQAQLSVADFQPSGAAGHHGGGAGRMRAWSASLARVPADPARGTAFTMAWAAHHAGAETTHAGLLEAQFNRANNILFGRVELVGRVEQETQFIYFEDGSHEHFEVPRRYRVAELSGGYARVLGSLAGIDASLGARGSINTIPSYIRARYDQADRGFAFAIFGRLSPVPTISHHHH
jgi:hypothetical protein